VITSCRLNVNDAVHHYIVVASYGALGTCPLDLQRFFSVHFDLYTKSDSDYMSIVASCKHPVTFACAPVSAGVKSWRRHCYFVLSFSLLKIHG